MAKDDLSLQLNVGVQGRGEVTPERELPARKPSGSSPASKLSPRGHGTGSCEVQLA